MPIGMPMDMPMGMPMDMSMDMSMDMPIDMPMELNLRKLTSNFSWGCKTRPTQNGPSTTRTMLLTNVKIDRKQKGR